MDGIQSDTHICARLKASIWSTDVFGDNAVRVLGAGIEIGRDEHYVSERIKRSKKSLINKTPLVPIELLLYHDFWQSSFSRIVLTLELCKLATSG